MTDSKLMHKSLLTVAVALVLVFLTIYLAVLIRNTWESYNYIGRSPEFNDRVTIAGEGRVTVKPDVAMIDIGVLTEGGSVESVQATNNTKMNAIVDVLKSEFAINDDDIKTSQYNIYPRYSYSDRTPRIIGYGINQAVVVKIRDFNNIGEILSQAGSLGANTISGPNFTIDDPEVYRSEAREVAIEQAKNKAKDLANQVGFTLGQVVGFNEGNGPSPIYYQDELLRSDVGYGGAEMAPKIEAGSQEVVVMVYLSYEIR